MFSAELSFQSSFTALLLTLSLSSRDSQRQQTFTQRVSCLTVTGNNRLDCFADCGRAQAPSIRHYSRIISHTKHSNRTLSRKEIPSAPPHATLPSIYPGSALIATTKSLIRGGQPWRRQLAVCRVKSSQSPHLPARQQTL